jgi:predicted dienelactone hydrolase
VLAALWLLALPSVRAAEQIHVYYGLLGRSLTVESLNIFAESGAVNPDLAPVVSRLQPEQQTWLRDFLNTPYQLDAVALSQFFSSSLGERLLIYAGELVQTEAGLNGFYAIRAALIQSAATPEGLSVLSILEQFPTNVRLNTERILQQLNQIAALRQATADLVAALEQATAEAARQSPTVFPAELNVQAPGPLWVFRQTRTLRDPARQRELQVEFYLPQGVPGDRFPVVIFSQGLGTALDRHAYLAQHLASHGIAIVIPQHPGSDEQQQQDFLQGLSSELFETAAFIDRPADISFVLDELEHLNLEEFDGRLNLQQVGMFGNSFGGNTALALAGATLDFNQLQQDCDPQLNLLSLSLLVQCQALELSPGNYALQDDRIKAISVLFPSGMSLYGQSGLEQIDVPVLWGAASQDIFSPLVLEQAPAFQALASSDKYFAVATGVNHLNLNLYTLRNLGTLDGITEGEITVNEPDIIRDYLNTLNLAFFKVHLAERSEYRPYLTAAYAQSLSNDLYDLNLVRSLDDILSPK